jgi:hypothetical protein
MAVVAIGMVIIGVAVIIVSASGNSRTAVGEPMT